MSFQQMASEEVFKLSPPAGVAGMVVFGVPLSDLVLWTTLLYTALQVAFTIYKWVNYNGKSKD